MAITLASDNFTRTNNASSWGTASDGEVWSRVVGSAALSIVGNQGKVVGSPAGTTYILLGTQTYLNGDVSHRFTTNTAGSSNMGIIVRYVDTNNYVRIAIVNGTTLRVDIVFGGVLTILAPTAAVAISANTAYRLHVNMSGASYFVNLWLDGTTEPTSHTLQVSDPNARFTLKGGLCGIYAGPGTALILLFDSYLVSATPQTVYVATTGSDSNPGTLASPWLTLQHACNLITPGSTVNVASGTYAQPNGVQLTNYISGIAIQRTQFISTTRLGAKVTGTGTTSVWDNEGNYVDFIGFEITTSDTSVREGMLNNGSNCSYQQCSAHDIKAVGGYPHGGAGLNHGGNLAANNDVIGCITYRNGSSTDPNGPSTHGIYIATPGCRVLNCISYQNSGWGIHLFHNPSNVLVSNNLTFNNVTGGVVIGADGSNTADYNTVQNNIFDGEQGTSGAIKETSGIGIHNYYYNNLVFNCANVVGGNGTPIAIQSVEIANGQLVGTLFADPKLVNYQSDGSGNYHLTVSSPCIGAAHAVNMPATDYDTATRISYDIGPYAYLLSVVDVATFPPTSRRAGTLPGTSRRTGVLPGTTRRAGTLPGTTRRAGTLPTTQRRTGTLPTTQRRTGQFPTTKRRGI